MVTQQGTPTEVTAHPRSDYVADLVGTTLVAGRVAGDVLTTSTGVSIALAGGIDTNGGNDAFAAIHPSAVALYRTRPDGSPRNLWPSTVLDVDTHHDRVRVRLDGPVPVTAEITPAALASLGLRPGDEVWASVKASEIHGYPA
jgi:molybdate transport system ATP-binding protein